MAHLGPILMGTEAKVLNFPGSGGGSSRPPSPTGGDLGLARARKLAVLTGSLRSSIFSRYIG